MKSFYPIMWLPATPEYILAYLQEEWHQFAGSCRLAAAEADKCRPTFNTTIRQWCDDAILDVKKWPKVFQGEINRLALGGLPFKLVNKFWPRLTGSTWSVGALLLIAGSISKVPEMIVVGVLLFAAGWLGGLLYRGPLALENVKTFRDLTEIIVKREEYNGFPFTKTPV